MCRAMLIALTLSAALPATAAEPTWTPAPVPGSSSPTVMPAARAGAAEAGVRDAPFSGVPSGTTAADGTTSSNVVNGVQTPDLSPR